MLELADYFLTTISLQQGKQITGFSPEARNLLRRYAWPGNVRELRNVIERIVTLARGTIISALDLPEKIRLQEDNLVYTGNSAPAKESILSLREVERRTITEALKLCRGNVSEATRKLGIGRNTLYRKMKEYEIEEW